MISKGISLTFHQVYDLAKTEESTKAQMQVITQGDQAGTVHSVRRKQKPDTPRAWTDVNLTAPVRIAASMTRNAKFHLQTSTSSNSYSMAVSGVETNTVLATDTCPAMRAKCQ